MPKVTVYIVSHNYGKYVQEAIESVLQQTFEDWELLLFDDNSSDNTTEIFELYRNDPRIKTYRTEGIGLPRVCNYALLEAKGEYLIRLDGDDYFDENIILVLTHKLEADKSLALVFPDYYLIDSSGGIFAQEKRARVYHNNHLMDVPAHGACTLIRKSVLKEIGGYREDLGAQDGFDLWTRTISKHRCTNVGLPLFYYRRHGKNLTEKHQRIFDARREIKKDAAQENLKNLGPITAIIPCREHYDVVPDLWNEQIDNNLTLLDISIQNCLRSALFESIVISSDTDKVLDVIDNYNDSRIKFVKRNTKLTIRSKPISESVYHALNEIEANKIGISVLTYIQAPFATTESIEEGIYSLALNDADSAFAVEEISHGLFKRSAYGLVPLNAKHMIHSDQDIIYGDARTSVATKNSNIFSGSLLGAKTVNYVTASKENFFIQSKFDLSIAKNLFSLNLIKEVN